jgi:hypothetical protein
MARASESRAFCAALSLRAGAAGALDAEPLAGLGLAGAAALLPEGLVP